MTQLPPRHSAFSLRSRVVLLLGLGAVPLALLAGMVIWQDYRTARQEPLDRVAVLRSAVLGSQRTALDGVQDLLRALVLSPEVAGATPEICNGFLGRVLELHASVFAAMAVRGPDGALRCHAQHDDVPPPGGTAPWFARIAGSNGLVLGLDPVPQGGAVVVALSDHTGGRATGIIEAGLHLAWFADRLTEVDGTLGAWLYGPEGQRLTVHGAGLPAPDGALLAGLLSQDRVASTSLPDGRLASYASGTFGPLRLVVAQPAGPAADAAWNRLLRRALALLVLLAATFGVVAVGATRMIVAPILTLGGAVRAWRAGAPFVRPPEAMPVELDLLADSMNAAVTRLAQREAELERAATRQDLLLQEVHHRVKNNLQVVASLLNLQASRIRQPQVRAEFQSARDRVRALSTLHRHLYIQGELHTINMPGFLAELCGQLFHAMGEQEGERIALDISAPEIQMLSDQAVPVALIVTEAVGNALKYAFPGGRHGRITVRLDAQPGPQNGTARLIVQDDGVGIPAGRADTEDGPRDGIGLQLIRGFARQLGAALSVDQGSGTRYVVEMPLHPADRPRDTPVGAETRNSGSQENVVRAVN